MKVKILKCDVGDGVAAVALAVQGSRDILAAVRIEGDTSNTANLFKLRKHALRIAGRRARKALAQFATDNGTIVEQIRSD